MQINIIIYTKNGTSPIAQVFDAMDIMINNRLNDVSTAEFSIPLFTPDGKIHEILKDISYLMKGNRIQITVQGWESETVAFDGMIDDTDDKPTRTVVRLIWYLWLLDQKIITTNASYVWQTVQSVLSGIISQINTIDDAQLSLSCWILDTIDKQYTGGTWVIQIIKEIADTIYQFTSRGKVIYFGKNIGVDRTVVGNDYFEFIYDYIDMRSNNVSDFSFKSSGKNIVNDVYTKGWSTIVNVNDPTSIATYYRRQAYISTKNSTELNKYLAEHKDETVELTLTPSNVIYSELDIWDNVRVNIDRWDARWKYDGSMTVTQKDIRFINGTIDVTMQLSNKSLRTPSILEKIKKIDADIQQLKIV